MVDRVRFLDACCNALPRLWRGESIIDSALGLKDASLGPIDVEPPPLIIGGGGRALMEVATRYAQGWNLFTQEPEIFASKTAELSSVVAATGRKSVLERSVYFFVERANRDLRVLLNDFKAAGADEAMLVVMHPSRDSILSLASQVLK